jgi:hypothetical protein
MILNIRGILRPFLSSFQRAVFLDAATLHRHVGDVEPRVPCDLNRIQFRSVGLIGERPKCAAQALIDCCILGPSPASPRTASQHPDVVPTCMADHGVKDRLQDPFYMRPVFSKGVPERIQRTRQYAVVAQEDRTQLHSFDDAAPACA